MPSPFELIAKTVEDYKKEMPILVGYSTWLLLPFAAFVLLSLLPLSPAVQAIAFVLMLAELFLIVWITIILSFYAYAHIHGHEKNIGVFSAKARTLVASVLSVTLLQLLILTGGLLLLIVPMFIFAVWFGLAQYAVMFEDKRGLDALAASRALTSGRFWSSAGLILLGPILLLLFYSFVLSLVVSIIGAVQGVDPVTLVSGDIPLWVEILEAIAQVFMLPFVAIYMTRVYVALKEVPSMK